MKRILKLCIEVVSKPPNRVYDQEEGETFHCSGIDWMERLVSTRRSGQRGGFETTSNALPAETIRSRETMSSLNRKSEHLIYRNEPVQKAFY